MSFRSLRIAMILFFAARSVGFGAAPDEPTHAQAVEALHRAVQFFQTEASIHGAYVFRWSEDLKLREGEEKVGDSTAWIQPPATPAVGRAYLDAYRLTEDPVLLQAARQTANALLRGQLISGGWHEQIEFAPENRQRYAYRVDSPDIGKRRNATTFDDDKSQSVIRFLARLDQTLEQSDPAIHEAALYALEAVVTSQYPNGSWPQKFEEAPDTSQFPVLRASYPSQWSREFPGAKYTSFYTLNDNTISDLIQTLLDAWDIYGDERYLEAAKRGGNFFLLAQMPEPQMGWAQQYDLNMHPAWARKFEPPAISGGESQGVMRMLILLYRRTGDPTYLTAVRTALPYYQKSILPDGRLARFYELQTNRPLYFTKEYELTYSDSDMPTHYGFIVSSSLDRIERELESLKNVPSDRLWLPAKPDSPKPSNSLSQAAANVIASLDSRGAWVEAGGLKTHEDAQVDRIIASSTFIKNLETLSKFIAATQ